MPDAQERWRIEAIALAIAIVIFAQCLQTDFVEFGGTDVAGADRVGGCAQAKGIDVIQEAGQELCLLQQLSRP